MSYIYKNNKRCHYIAQQETTCPKISWTVEIFILLHLIVTYNFEEKSLIKFGFYDSVSCKQNYNKNYIHVQALLFSKQNLDSWTVIACNSTLLNWDILHVYATCCTGSIHILFESLQYKLNNTIIYVLFYINQKDNCEAKVIFPHYFSFFSLFLFWEKSIINPRFFVPKTIKNLGKFTKQS